ncbi:MAG: hypothetical protein RL338_582 [Chloroflexota bacterium]|jgi:peptidoglycan hydrolase CwlO-like protein
MTRETTPLRRAIVAGGAIAALATGALSVSAAAGFVATNDPTPDPTTGPLTQALAAERERSVALSTRLTELQEKLIRLESGISAAESNAGSDAAAIDELRTALADAQAELAELEAKLAREAAAARAAQAAPPTVATTGASGDWDDDEDGEEEHEDHEEHGEDDD